MFPPEDTIYLVLPPASPGTSGALVKADERASLLARERDGILSVHTIGEGGVARELAAASVAELAGYDVRVSVVDAEGRGRSWTVRGWREVEADEVGPVIDLFRGMLPLGPGDWIVTTEVRRPWTGPAVEGRAALELGGRHFFAACTAPDASPGWAIVDTAAGSTVIARAMVPEGVVVEPATMMERSASGTRVLDARPIGATGEVGGVIGQAVLPSFTVGGLAFGESPVRVLDELPELDGRRVLAILGIDLLSRCGGIVLVPPTAERPGALELRDELDVAGTGAWCVPFSRASGLLFVRGGAGDARVPLALDSGASWNLLDRRAAERYGFEPDADQAITLRGLGGQPEEARGVLIPELELGGRAVPDVAFYAFDLAALASLARSEPGGVLGAPFLARLERLEIDLRRGALRIFERRGE